MSQLSNYLQLVIELNNQPKPIPQQVDQYKEKKKMNKRYIGSYKSKDNKKTGCVSGFGATSLKTDFPLIKNENEFQMKSSLFKKYSSVWYGQKNKNKFFV